MILECIVRHGIYSGSKNVSFTASVNQEIPITLRIIERDKNSDVGVYTTRVVMSDYVFNNGFHYEGEIYVYENGGRYKGNHAVWSISINIKKQK